MTKIGINHAFDKGSIKDNFQVNGFTLETLYKHNLQNELKNLSAVVLYALEGHEAIYEWIVEIRKYSAIHIWVCVPKEKIKVQSLLYLHLGVDGVFKADDLDELVVTMRRSLFRNETTGTINRGTTIGLIPNKLSIEINQKEVALTRLEYDLFAKLLENTNEVTTYETLKEGIWGERAIAGTNTQLANLVLSLRNKLKQSQMTITIKTIRTKGYMLVS